MLDRRDLLKAAALGAAAGAVPGLASGDGTRASPPRAPRLTVRRAAERGHADHGWLDTRHTFSFASYMDPAHMGFRGLRVINEDRVTPGQGFPTHPHRDMEIVTYVLEGALQHKDSLGNGGVIVPGEVQRMSAGTGITHSEFNASHREGVHFLQIWMLPDVLRVRPGYAQKSFPQTERNGVLRLVASRDGRAGSISIQADTNLYAATLGAEGRITHVNPANRNVWLQVARGTLDVNGTALAAGDGLSTSDPGTLAITSRAGAEVLLFDLA